MLEYAAGLLEEQAASMSVLDADAPADLTPYIEGGAGLWDGRFPGHA